MNAKKAHAAKRRNFHRTLKRAAHDYKWFPKALGGDGRLEEAKELWYAAHPDQDIRASLEYEPDECTDPQCEQCNDPHYWDGY